MLSSLPTDLKKVPQNKIDQEILRVGIIAELDAVSFYEQLAAMTKNRQIKKILMDIAKEEKTHNQLVKLLQALKVGEMYFEPPDPKEPQMQSAFRNYSCEEFVNFIIQNSCLKHYKLIGSAEDGRKLYKLW